MSSMVSQVLYYNQNQQYPSIQQDCRDIKKHVDKAESTDATIQKAALESIPMFRRVASLPEKIENGDAIPALGLAGLALINLPEDMRDLKGAGKQLRGAFDKDYQYDPLYNRKTHQHSFSFLSIFTQGENKQQKIAMICDLLKERYGYKAVNIGCY